MNHTVYGLVNHLVDPHHPDYFFYIGITERPLPVRLGEHLSTAYDHAGSKTLHCQDTRDVIRYIYETSGLCPKIILLMPNLTDEFPTLDARNSEVEITSIFLSLGYNLTGRLARSLRNSSISHSSLAYLGRTVVYPKIERCSWFEDLLVEKFPGVPDGYLKKSHTLWLRRYLWYWRLSSDLTGEAMAYNLEAKFGLVRSRPSLVMIMNGTTHKRSPGPTNVVEFLGWYEKLEA